MTDTLLTIFARRIAPLPMDARGPILAAYDCYLRGHIKEGFEVLGLPHTSQGAPDLRAAIEARVTHA